MNQSSQRIVSRSVRQRRELAAWLAEREIDLALREPDSVPNGLVPRASLIYAQTSEKIRSGDIYLLKPVPSGISFGPVYVLLLYFEENRCLLAVPFSRYAKPAVPGECLTGLRATPLRTLCCWNARAVRESQLLSGHVKRLPAPKLKELRLKCGHILFNEPVTGNLGGFGPPLRHPADPRYAYLDEERRRLDVHFNTGEHTEKRITEYGEQNMEHKTWLMAAESRAHYGKKPRG